MTIEQANQVCEILSDDLYEATVQTNYSGRGMYGRSCIAIRYNGPATLVGAACSKAGVENGSIPKRIDRLGFDEVYY